MIDDNLFDNRDFYYKLLILSTVFFLFIGQISFSNKPDHDMFHEMALARESINFGYIPDHDLYSYIPTLQPLVHHEWGNGFLLYTVTVIAGLGSTGIISLKYLFSLAIFIMCIFLQKRHNVNYGVYSLLGVIAISMGWIGFTTIRAQLLTLFFLTLQIYLLEVDRSEKKWWIIPWLLVYLIWLNVHAGFVVGIAYYFFYTGDRFLVSFRKNKEIIKSFHSIKHLIIVLGVMIPLIVINPFGLDYFTYLWRALFLDRSELISEWRPIWRFPQGVAIYYTVFYLLSVLILIYTVIHKKNFRSLILIFILILAYQTIFQLRLISIYALFWLLFVPFYLNETPLSQFLIRFTKNMRNLLIYFWLIIGFAGLFLSLQNQFWQLSPIDENNPYPMGVVEYLREHHFSGNLMTPFREGAYISWKLYPQVKVSMDSRYEVAYDQKFVIENVNFYKGAAGWERILCQYETDAILIPKSQPLYEKIQNNIIPPSLSCPHTWIKVYSDDLYEVYMKENISKYYPMVKRQWTPTAMQFP
jgi:hypothetical protein